MRRQPVGHRRRAPAGLVVHPAPGNPDHTLVNALLAHCGDSLSGIGGVRRPGIVHRLDKNTSGVMVVAKNDRSHQALSKLFAAHDLTRIYQALVWGTPKPKKGTIPCRKHNDCPVEYSRCDYEAAVEGRICIKVIPL